VSRRARGRARAEYLAVAAALSVLALTSCDDDTSPAADVVEPAEAITAIIAWQADEQEPVLDDDGEPQLPVIFVVAGDGETIDVGIQASVAAATDGWAHVRFADDVADTFDAGTDGEPVRDDGAMLLLGPLPEPASSVEVDLARYTAIDEMEVLQLEISNAIAPDDTAPDPTPTATVTAIRQP
jgi:hypothetical protein